MTPSTLVALAAMVLVAAALIQVVARQRKCSYCGAWLRKVDGTWAGTCAKCGREQQQAPEPEGPGTLK